MKTLLLDGGLGTTLQLPPYNTLFSTSTPLWSGHLLLSAPTTLRAVHQAFATAGADIILTATYQTSVAGFARTTPGIEPGQAEGYMRSAVPLAGDIETTSGKGGKAEVALSLGPYGATLETGDAAVAAEYSGVYPGDIDEGRLRVWHAERLGVFAVEGTWERCAYVAIETVRRADEVRAARGAMGDVLAKSGRERLPWWICGVFPGEEVNEGEVRGWVRAALVGQGRPWGIGVNCTKIGNVGRIVEIMGDEMGVLERSGEFVDEWASESKRPWLVLYPDGTQGEVYDPVSKIWVTPAGAQGLSRPWDEVYWDVVKSVPEGAWEGVIMGGCCRAGPDEIAALRRRIDQ